jgi:glycerol uptake facilitator protein
MEYKVWQRLAAEFIGTAFLVFVGVGSVPALFLARGGEGGAPFTGAELGIIALAFGLIVTATVYAFGHISGNHINPAVTLALAATGKFPWREVPGYIVAQVAGAILGAFAIVGVLGMAASDAGLGVAAYSDDVGAGRAFVAEAVGTFILVLAIFGAIHRRAPAGFAGIAIGFVVFAAIIVPAPATGASINPARTTGPMIVQAVLGGDVQWEQWPVYVAAEIVGGVLAGLLYVFISNDSDLTAMQAETEISERDRTTSAAERTRGEASA